MADKKQQIIPPHASRLPVTQNPKPSLPALPSSSGSFWGSPTTILKKDSAYVVAHTEHLLARRDQADAMRSLVESREQLAVAISKLHALPEVCAHEYQKGFLTRTSELKVLALKLQTDEVHAEIQLAAARHARAQYEPQPEVPSAPPAPAGLTPAEIQAVLEAFPDVKPELIEPIVMMLRGVLAEKKS